MRTVMFADYVLMAIVLKGHFSAAQYLSDTTVQCDKVYSQHVTKATKGVITVAWSLLSV